MFFYLCSDDVVQLRVLSQYLPSVESLLLCLEKEVDSAQCDIKL